MVFYLFIIKLAHFHFFRHKNQICAHCTTMYVSGTYYCDGGGNCSALFMDACENTVVYKCPHEHCVQELRSQLCVPRTF